MGDVNANDIWDLYPVPTLVLSPACIIQKVSDGLLDAWKCQRDHFVGKDVYTALYADSPLERFDRIPLTRAIQVAISSSKSQICYAGYNARGSSWSARVTPITRNNELLSLVLEWEPVTNNLNAVAGEMTQNMLSVDETLRLLIQSVKDYAIFLLDTRGYVATWNPGAELLKGYARGDIIGTHFSRFYGDEDLEAGKPEKELEICLREGRVEDEGWRYRKDGSRFWANVVITAVYRNGIHVGFGKVTRDLTERRDAQLRLVEAYEESAKLKNDFLASMSHEIRTPMHGMLSACALLLETSLTENQREMADLIAESGQILLQVINSILDYSKLASGNVAISSLPIDIPSIISSVTRNVQVRLRPQVQLKVDVSPDLPVCIQGDPLRFRQVVQNIVDNAVKFTEEGSVSVQTSVSGEDHLSYTILTTVTDTGIGVKINEAAVQDLYKPFFQLDQSTNKRFQGTGLGLSIAKSLVDLMNGDMGYRPNPDTHGSVFWFTAKFQKLVGTTPKEENARKVQPLSLSQDSNAMSERLHHITPNKRILAAEDNLINQKVLVRLLRSFGLSEIDMVCNGAEAVSMLNSSKPEYDLILMDVSMPVMDGFEATSKIRKNGVTHIPIVAMTAHALAGDMEKCLEKGMDDYIAKPLNRELLMQILLRWLDPPERLTDGLSKVAITL
jgi:osomolarity two-component system, sensor histidine kinase TcsA